ncbi:rod shape-determining protein MreD [Candidatus Moduliflexus flocculans]|uniref:Rod shape-determining protein MreD n=1 Tax=Candidatus Moduliflexus flocculans TaxID=1499966 RepID=A0A081BSM9_9BACT|nr:rod shape-determining protein MreD [Candidatus Moduliflexus flocculans]
MYLALTLIIVLGAMVIQTSIFPLVFLTIKPDLLLVIVVYLGLRKGPEIGCLSGFAFGLMQDASSEIAFGANAFAKTILGFLSGVAGKQLYTQSVITHMLCVGFSTVAGELILLGLQGFQSDWQRLLLYETCYNMLCCPFIVGIFRGGEKRLGI